MPTLVFYEGFYVAIRSYFVGGVTRELKSTLILLKPNQPIEDFRSNVDRKVKKGVFVENRLLLTPLNTTNNYCFTRILSSDGT